MIKLFRGTEGLLALDERDGSSTRVLVRTRPNHGRCIRQPTGRVCGTSCRHVGEQPPSRPYRTSATLRHKNSADSRHGTSRQSGYLRPSDGSAVLRLCCELEAKISARSLVARVFRERDSDTD